MLIKKSILKVVAGVVTIVNAANADADAAHTRGLRAESLESMANNTTSIIEDDVDDVIMFKLSFSSPTHDSIHGCVKADDNLDLSVYQQCPKHWRWTSSFMPRNNSFLRSN